MIAGLRAEIKKVTELKQKMLFVVENQRLRESARALTTTDLGVFTEVSEEPQTSKSFKTTFHLE